MFRVFCKIKKYLSNELPIIKLYSVLYLIGVFIGVGAAILLKNQFSEQARLIFSPENGCSFWAAFLQQAALYVFMFFLGLTAIGIPIVPIYPLYKGFSLGILVSICIVFYGAKGLLLGFPAFFVQNIVYTFLGYFICYSSARLSISLFQLIRGYGKHGAAYRELIHHVYCIFLIFPGISVGALWEWKVVPLILRLF